MYMSVAYVWCNGSTRTVESHAAAYSLQSCRVLQRVPSIRIVCYRNTIRGAKTFKDHGNEKILRDIKLQKSRVGHVCMSECDMSRYVHLRMREIWVNGECVARLNHNPDTTLLQFTYFIVTLLVPQPQPGYAPTPSRPYH